MAHTKLMLANLNFSYRLIIRLFKWAYHYRWWCI